MRLLGAELGHVAKDGFCFVKVDVHGSSCLVLALPAQDRLHAVRRVVGLQVFGEAEDFPGEQAERGPGLLDQGHVGGEVVVHVEFGGGGAGVEDGGCDCHFGGEGGGEERLGCVEVVEEERWWDEGQR